MSIVSSIFNFLRFNKKNWKAVALCILTAMIFWFFNALNKNYSTNINFPIAFDYDQERYIPTETLPTTIRMNVNGPGWDLFRRSLGFKVPPLVIPLEKPAAVRKMVGATLPAIFAGQLERLTINFVITDTVHLRIEEKLKRKFSVAIDSVSQYIHPDFGLAGVPRLTPETVWLEGPADRIQDMPETLRLTLPQTNIRKNFDEAVNVLNDPTNLITASPQKINVLFNVEKLVQVDTKIALRIINLPPRVKLSGVAREVSCVYRLPASVSETFRSDSLVALIDVSHKSVGTHKVVPQIMGLPENAVIVKTDTVVINF